MQALTNPYTPNAGAEPQAVVGRDDQLESFDFLLARIERAKTEQSMIITGLRGVGKTVLLGQFRTKALERDWVVVELEVSKNDESHFRAAMATKLRTALFELSPKARWTDRFTHAASVLRSFTISVDVGGTVSAGLDVDAAEGFADHGNLALDMTDVFVAIGEAAKERERGVVLLFDEVQFLNKQQLEAVIGALHKMVQRKLPVTLVGAGLPQIAELAGDAKSYAERLFKFPSIGNLDDGDARAALSKPAADEGIAYTDDALVESLEVTGGYPYFLQELGYAVWTVAEGPIITRDDIHTAVPGYEAKLDESFFRVRLDRATETQRAYLRAMAGLGPAPQKASDVADAMGRTSQNLGPTRAELINMGLLYTPEHGYAAFTVPHFDKFLLRAIPTLSVPTLKPRKRKE
ncbi:ATP-binding protein [Herbiconiux sp. KACC 21604]|uniref:ATP-binding protein n=1 Tax=unclassified Herbiconiux TaxID=2618217 RepID=UPI00149275B9|nr:ATP-binding protein [Herbiconiux sp. SALV-R1]QJU55085.1 ATP-binding protein [Herbiconiux sp. SALV-R1]WPO86231.1 ATP-binding protein [Herbiconiux sp. KACC 21604]